MAAQQQRKPKKDNDEIDFVDARRNLISSLSNLQNTPHPLTRYKSRLESEVKRLQV